MRYKTKMRLSLVALTALTVIFLWALWTASNAVLTGLAFGLVWQYLWTWCWNYLCSLDDGRDAAIKETTNE